MSYDFFFFFPSLVIIIIKKIGLCVGFQACFSFTTSQILNLCSFDCSIKLQWHFNFRVKHTVCQSYQEVYQLQSKPLMWRHSLVNLWVTLWSLLLFIPLHHLSSHILFWLLFIKMQLYQCFFIREALRYYNR